MSSRPQASLPELLPPAATRPERGSISTRLSRRKILNTAIFVFLCLFAILLPHSIKGSQHAWQLACLVWLAAMFLQRQRPLSQPLTAPLLAYIVCSAISTALSPDPVLSWDRMKIACLLLVSVVVAQNLHRLKQVRTVVYLLILSGVAAAAFTAWQYTYGVGVKVARIAPDSPLARARVVPEDIITGVDGRSVHSPAQLEQAIEHAQPEKLLRVEYVRGSPFHKKETFVTREEMLKSGLGTPALLLARGKPLKAQGTLGHYVNFAEMLMQVCCMAWAVLLATGARNRRRQVLLVIACAALTATLFMTEVRAALAGLALGGLISVLILAGKRSRTWASAAVIVLSVAALLWIHHTRGPHWLGTHDPGTSFRTMMWEDAPRLIARHPLFGVGMETIRTHWMEWHIRAYSYFHDESHFHNDLIQIAVERGLLTLAAWLWFCVAYVVLLIRVIRKARKRSRFAAGVATGTLAGFAAYQLTALVHYDLGIESVAMLLYFFVGLAIALDRMLQTPGAIDVP